MVGVFFTVWAKQIFNTEHIFFNFSAHWVKKTQMSWPKYAKGREKKKIGPAIFL